MHVAIDQSSGRSPRDRQRLEAPKLLQRKAGLHLAHPGQAVQAALPTLAPQGSISLTSGLLSRKMVPGQVLKTTLNAALEALGKHLAKELAPRRVNVISPGVTATEAYAGMPEEARQAMFARTAANLPVGRVGQPDEVAAAFILAMENGFISGSLIDVDGGGLL